MIYRNGILFLLLGFSLQLAGCGDEAAEKPLLDSTSLNSSAGLKPDQVSSAIQKDKPATLRIMTFNIKGIPCLDSGAAKSLLTTVGVKKCPLTDDAYTRSLDARVAGILEKLKALQQGGNGPDVVLIQEAFYSKNSLFTNQAVRNIPANSGYPYYAWGPEGTVNNGMDDYWNLVKQDQSKLKGLLSSGLLVLSRYPILGKESMLFGPNCAVEDCVSNKGAILVRVSAPSIGTVDILNTHMQAQTEQSAVRQKQVGQLAPWVKQTAITPFVFLGGDFNAHTAPEAPEMAQLRAGLANLKDGGKECSSSPSTCQVANNAFAPRLAGGILDHIFAMASSPFLAKPKKAYIYDWTLNDVLSLSDHKPIMLEYELALEP